MRTLMCFVLAFVALACAPMDQRETGDAVTLDASPAATAPGGSITLTLRNGSDGDVGYNLCTSGLQRRSGATWQPVPEDRACTMELRLLGPGGTADIALDLPSDLAAGEYRYETRVEEMATGEAMQVASNTFRVD